MSFAISPGAPPAGETFLFSLDYTSVTIEAFERCGLFKGRGQGTAPQAEDMASARRSLALELASWSNRGVNLWDQDSDSIALQTGVAVYTLSDPIVSILEAWYTLPGTSGQNTTDRLLWPMGRTEYAMVPNKQLQAPPTRYYTPRQQTPNTPLTIIFWPTPEQAATVNYFYLRWQADVTLPASGQSKADVPQRFLDALCAGTAARLAMKYAFQRYPALKAEAAKAWAEAVTEDREIVDIQITPDLGRYWRI